MRVPTRGGLSAAVLTTLLVTAGATPGALAGGCPDVPPPPWYEDFNAYPPGTFLHGTCGWKGWANDPAFDAAVTDVPARSGQAVQIEGNANLVHEYLDPGPGAWTYSAWQYIPSDFVSGGNGSWFILLNTYQDPGPWDASVQIQVDSNDGLFKVHDYALNPAGSVPYDTDRWVRIDVIVNLETDWTQVYYDDNLVTEYSWTGGVLGDGGGALDIAAVDLYAAGSSSVFYDDFALEPAPDIIICPGEFPTVPWYEDFEPYPPGSGLHGECGWKGWDDDPAFDAPVTDAQANSGSQSVDINGEADLVREFGSPDPGTYSFTAWQYIPLDFASAGGGQFDGTWFVLLNTYQDGGPYDWSVQLQFDSNDGMLKVYDGAPNLAGSVPYDTDRWVKIQTVISLEHDWTQIYYDDELVAEYSWTGGVLGGGTGVLDIAAVDLYAFGSTSVYYDDLRLEPLPEPFCPGALPWYEDFDDYDPGSSLHGGCGWKGWDDDPAFDAPVTDVQSNSGTQSVRIEGGSDLVREHIDLDLGTWSYSAWQYIPSDFASGGGGQFDGTYFLLLNTYQDAGPYDWSTRLQFDSNDGMLKVYDGDFNIAGSMPYDTDRWVKIEAIVNLETDWTQVYYDDNLITEYSWTGGVFGGGGGALDIAAVELYAAGSSTVFYDDLLLEELPPEPCPADLDGDNTVGVTDFLLLLAQWGTSPGGPPDFDGDGVGITDFLFLLSVWGPCE